MNTVTDANSSNFYYVVQMWLHPESFLAADAWIAKLGSAARWCPERGCSYINGTAYPAAVYFQDSTDYLIFKIKWPELGLNY